MLDLRDDQIMAMLGEVYDSQAGDDMPDFERLMVASKQAFQGCLDIGLSEDGDHEIAFFSIGFDEAGACYVVATLSMRSRALGVGSHVAIKTSGLDDREMVVGDFKDSREAAVLAAP